MGVLRNNQPRAVTREKILRLIRESLENGEKTFPSERKLAEMTGGSRTVVRSILLELEENGQLEQLSKERIVNADASRIPVLFITRGRNIAANHAWMRLWMALAARAEKTTIAPELALIGFWDEEIEENLKKIRESEAQYIVITSLDDIPSDLLEKWKTEGRNIICVDENDANSGYPVIARDNFDSGFLAAQTIAEKGFSRPGFLDGYFGEMDYKPREKRLEGFIAGCIKCGLPFDRKKNIYSATDNKVHTYIDIAKRIAQSRDIDSLFIPTDDDIGIISRILVEEGIVIPDELGIITINAQNIAVSRGFDCISHVSYETADALVANIQKHAKNKIEKIPTILIKPTVHKGESLCRRNLK